jgi:hypothetical protein
MLILLLCQALQTDLLPEAMATFQVRIWADLAPLLAYRLAASLNTDDLVALRESLAVAGHPLPEAVPETSSEISWESLSPVLEQLGPEASWKVLGAVMKQISLPFAIGSSGEWAEIRLVLGNGQ